MSAHTGGTPGKGKQVIGRNNRNEITLGLLEDLGAMSDGVDVDVDDLFSDESDNDDLIDNEADLALLLRTHGVTLDDPPPPPPLAATVSRGMSSNHAGTTMMQPGASQSVFLPGGPGPSITTSTPPRHQDSGDAQTWMAAMERQYEEEIRQQQASLTQQSQSFVYIHNHASAGQSGSHLSTLTPASATTVTPTHTVALPKPSSSSYEIGNSNFSQEQFEGDGWGATRANTTAAQAASEPELFVMDPEENKRLTGIIRSQTANALEINRTYQSALEQKLRDIEEAHNRNKKLRVNQQP